MIEIDRAERDCITHILQLLRIDTVDNTILSQIMTVLGFQTDVAFAKSLLADKIAFIYAHNQGQYEKFLALDNVSQLPYAAKCLIFTVFRRYSEAKIKQQFQKRKQISTQSDITQLTMPDSNSIDEIIRFQQKMYQSLKHLIPKHDNNRLYSFGAGLHAKQNEMPAFRFNSYSAAHTHRNLDYQYLSSMQNPVLPQFNNRSFMAHPTYEPQKKSNHFFSFRSEPFPHNDQLFSKFSYGDTRRQMQSFAQFENKNNGSVDAQGSCVKEEVGSKGFTAYSCSQMRGGPCKRVKKDSFVSVFNGQEITNKEIQMGKKTRQSLDKQVSPQKDSMGKELNIKHSISEYLADDKQQPYKPQAQQ